MKKSIISLLIFLMTAIFAGTLAFSPSTALGNPFSPDINTLKGKDRFQAETWWRLAKQFAAVGDYATFGYYSNLIIKTYPNSYYATDLQKLLKKRSTPKKNRGREKKKDNPGFYFW